MHTKLEACMEVNLEYAIVMLWLVFTLQSYCRLKCEAYIYMMLAT